MNYKIGDKVIATSSEAHADEPHAAPEVGTIGILIKHCNLTRWRVKWADGSTTEDDVWGANECDFELWSKKEMTALEYITEWQRYQRELQRTGKQHRLSAILDPEMIDTVAKWAAEHPKPAPISAEDYEKLKALHMLFGDCWVAKNTDGECAVFNRKPILKHEARIGLNFEYWGADDTNISDDYALKSQLACVTAEEPLHLTADWLKEVQK